MSAIEVIRREKKKNKKLQAELDKKKDTQELEQMITKLKVQIEEDKRIEEALKEQLEGKDRIIGNLEAEIVTLRKEYSTTKPMEIVHTDLVGLTTTKGLKGERYFMLLVDDYTRMTAICFLKNKSKAFENFKIYKEMVENEMDSRIKCLRSDNGGEFT
jgi:hypothetical protein